MQGSNNTLTFKISGNFCYVMSGYLRIIILSYNLGV